MILRYLQRVSGYSHQTLTRLVAQYQASGKRRRKSAASAFTGCMGTGVMEALSHISVSHLYNLRKANGYRRQRRHFEKTRPHALRSPNGANPSRRGDPDCLRFDTVHQGDLDGIKGVYHISAVDEVTQFQCVFSVEPISERFLIPMLKALIETASMPITARGAAPVFLDTELGTTRV